MEATPSGVLVKFLQLVVFEVTHKKPKCIPFVKGDALSMALKESRFQVSAVTE